MKKVLLIAAVAVLALASCKKERDCTCTINGETSVTTFPKESKKDQETACDALQSMNQILSADATCTLD
tara:strand:- start:280 stop:486 length:207 start_codon:yes stop_codon:yes gene_type:complete